MDRLSPRWTRGRSYAYCDRLARRAAGNFYHAFRFLPAQQRRAMCALYAFLRIADDLGDCGADVEVKRLDLLRWRDALHAALTGEYRHPIHPALHHAIVTYDIPVRHLEEVLDGVEMDLVVAEYETFGQLHHYCYHVASSVGLACLAIWGYRGISLAQAEAAGVALQLTNILRDVGEDLRRGRMYLPCEDIARFGCDIEKLRRGERDESFRALMRFEATRAYEYYDAALPLARELEPAGRAMFLVMLRTYRALLDAIVASDFDVLTRRVRVDRWRKVWLALRALPVRWGCLPE